MTLIEYIPIIISIITYAIVFVIQKSLYTKQNDLMNSYKEVLKIMSLDEIKKHVALKEENLILNFENREKKIKKAQNVAEEKLEQVGQVLLDSENVNNELINMNNELKNMHIEMKALFDDKIAANLLMEKTNKYIDGRKNIDEKLIKLFDDEFDEIYDFIKNDLKASDESKEVFFVNNILGIRNKYLVERTELLKNREQLI